jgi:hypothetical protein
MTNPIPRAETVRLGDMDYPVDLLSTDGRGALNSFVQTEGHLMYLRNMEAVLTKARNAYIADLKDEILKGRTGLDYSDMLSDD